MSVKAGQMFQLDRWMSFGRAITELKPTADLRQRWNLVESCSGLIYFTLLVGVDRHKYNLSLQVSMFYAEIMDNFETVHSLYKFINSIQNTWI